MLGSYNENIKGIDVDNLWQRYDKVQMGFLPKILCFEFLRELKKYMVKERASNYQEDNFNQLFVKCDEDKNGVIEKNEMPNFIK